MSESSHPRRVLHLLVGGFPAEKLAPLVPLTSTPVEVTDIFHLTEANAPEALEKIFAADTIAVWGKTD